MEKVKKLACRKAKGFTLIELLIVIAIIAILAAIILVSLSSARNRAKDTKIKGDMNAMSKALEIMLVDQDLPNSGGWAVVREVNVAQWKDVDGKRLIAKLPAHPISGENFWAMHSAQSYALLARLMLVDHYWCVKNGSAREVTGTILQARTDCGS